MKVILTTNAMSGHIEVIEAEFQLTSFMHVWTGKPGERVFYKKPDWHESRESAVARVNSMFDRLRGIKERKYAAILDGLEQKRQATLRKIEKLEL